MYRIISSLWALTWALLWLVFVPTAIADVPTVVVVMGLSREISADFPVDSVEPESSPHYHYLKVMEGSDVRKILIVPRQPGDETLTVFSKDKRQSLSFLIHVAPAGDKAAVKAQMAAERAEGITVRIVTLTAPVHKLDVDRPIGPIYLTNPQVLEFRRVASEPKTVLIAGRADGLTDLWVHDDNGKLIAKYYVHGRDLGGSLGIQLPLPGPIKYFDLNGDRREAVY